MKINSSKIKTVNSFILRSTKKHAACTRCVGSALTNFSMRTVKLLNRNNLRLYNENRKVLKTHHHAPQGEFSFLGLIVYNNNKNFEVQSMHDIIICT